MEIDLNKNPPVGRLKMPKALKNKKGVFFTFISLLLLTTLMVLFKPETEISFNQEIEAEEIRVAKLDNFIKNFENVYLPESIRLSGSRALTALTLYMVTEGFLADLQPAFTEVLLNGTIDGTPIDDITGEEIMKDNDLMYWISRVESSAEDILNIGLSGPSEPAFGLKDVKIGQTTPWLVDINLTISYNLSSETAYWERTNISISSKLGIASLYDPLYSVNTNRAYEKNITATDIKFGEWDANNLSLFIGEEEYAHWENSNAPSFLMRYTEDFSSSECCGIESAVNPDKLAAQENRIYIDYSFFNPAVGDCSNPGILYTINGISNNFKLDWNNAVKYNVTGDASELLCP